MKEISLRPPEFSMIAGTRAMLGAGIALLFAERLNKDQRKAVGWTLLLTGLISTVPLGMIAFCKRNDKFKRGLKNRDIEPSV